MRSLPLRFDIHVVDRYATAHFLDSTQNAPVHVVFQPSPPKRCVTTVSGVHTARFLNAELDSGPGILVMATYVMRFLAILSLHLHYMQ